MSGRLPDRLVSFGRWIRGRCGQCGARAYNGYTVLEAVCRTCGYRPESESSRDLTYRLIALGIIVTILLVAAVALFAYVVHH